MNVVQCSKEGRRGAGILFQKELFQGTQENALVYPLKEKLNTFDRPDREIKALPPSKYAMKELEQMHKSFMEIFDSLDD